jgi:hypothetical protein
VHWTGGRNIDRIWILHQGSIHPRGCLSSCDHSFLSGYRCSCTISFFNTWRSLLPLCANSQETFTALDKLLAGCMQQKKDAVERCVWKIKSAASSPLLVKLQQALHLLFTLCSIVFWSACQIKLTSLQSVRLAHSAYWTKYTENLNYQPINCLSHDSTLPTIGRDTLVAITQPASIREQAAYHAYNQSTRI